MAIAEKCTNTSSPPSCSMKPYPLASLNHFTFPLITIRLLQGLVTQPNVDARKDPPLRKLSSGFSTVRTEPDTTRDSARGCGHNRAFRDTESTRQSDRDRLPRRARASGVPELVRRCRPRPPHPHARSA